MSIIRVLDELPAEESAHLSNKGKRSKPAAGGSGSRRRGGTCPIGSAAFKLHFGYLKEGTMQVEVSRRSGCCGQNKTAVAIAYVYCHLLCHQLLAGSKSALIQAHSLWF